MLFFILQFAHSPVDTSGCLPTRRETSVESYVFPVARWRPETVENRNGDSHQSHTARLQRTESSDAASCCSTELCHVTFAFALRCCGELYVNYFWRFHVHLKPSRVRCLVSCVFSKFIRATYMFLLVNMQAEYRNYRK